MKLMACVNVDGWSGSLMRDRLQNAYEPAPIFIPVKHSFSQLKCLILHEIQTLRVVDHRHNPIDEARQIVRNDKLRFKPIRDSGER